MKISSLLLLCTLCRSGAGGFGKWRNWHHLVTTRDGSIDFLLHNGHCGVAKSCYRYHQNKNNIIWILVWTHFLEHNWSLISFVVYHVVLKPKKKIKTMQGNFHDPHVLAANPPSCAQRTSRRRACHQTTSPSGIAEEKSASWDGWAVVHSLLVTWDLWYKYLRTIRYYNERPMNWIISTQVVGLFGPLGPKVKKRRWFPRNIVKSKRQLFPKRQKKSNPTRI